MPESHSCKTRLASLQIPRAVSKYRNVRLPTCRWVKGETVLDMMPLDEKVLGFTNKWYQPAIEAAEEREILPAVVIRVISSPYFCATKFEAFEGRGAGDYLASHDLEDIRNCLKRSKSIVSSSEEA